MNDASLIKGVISAYDARTGKVIFEKIHNVVMAWEKAYLLSYITGVDDISDMAMPAGEITTNLTSMLSSGNGKIDSFDVGYDDTTTYPTEDASKSSVTILSADNPIGFFGANDTYKPSDITIAEKDKRIIYTPEKGAFARLKLSVSGNMIGSVTDADFLANGQQVNFVALKDSLGNRLTQFRFPEICFYSNTSVDFEYRIYL